MRKPFNQGYPLNDTLIWNRITVIKRTMWENSSKSFTDLLFLPPGKFTQVLRTGLEMELFTYKHSTIDAFLNQKNGSKLVLAAMLHIINFV